ncbi:urea transporter [Colwellia demingiae]|uniref:Urea transporter n=1 Tax=Colwellia demingiae TaxID=89401 RepID=A0A5C6QHZ8_9GAMM|nr:urea transporter [Colwellia demingiae]TWX68675.1 urea transporter [Colwellia demingiae]
MNYLFEPFAKRFLSSSAQIMLQSNAITGLLFLVGIGVNSPTMLLGCILAISSSLAIAKLLQYDSNCINKGLYGFNAALVGLAVFSLLPLSFISLVLVLLGGAFSALIMHLMITKMPDFPALTTPFILSIWTVVLIMDSAGLSSPMQGRFTGSISPTLIDSLHGVLRGVGQVMLQDNWLSGAIFCCALLFSSYKKAVWAILGSLIGLLVATTFGFSQEKAMMGLYGFNGCLVAIALVDRYPNKYWLIMLAILSSVVFTRVFEMVAIPAFTAPFVMTTWLMIGVVKLKPDFG